MSFHSAFDYTGQHTLAYPEATVTNAGAHDYAGIIGKYI